ncbi:mitotic-spindle organizing protein 2-like [Camelus ferus]|uniref:Mitotic-spindle organizing protein 2-like n=1 Tax=Camelus ferus TaxID=419612 RepID=A0A8B8T0Q7_CAMFR|nr:mitotic-spindle organizing protein 2-like [Camelus ferus]
MDPDVFKILVDLLKLKEAPLAIFQMLKSMCAAQRLVSEPQDPAAVPLPAPSVLLDPREEQGQRRAQRRPNAGRTQGPGKIKLDDAPASLAPPGGPRQAARLRARRGAAPELRGMSHAPPRACRPLAWTYLSFPPVGNIPV